MGQGLRDQEADYISLVLMTQAGYDTADVDVFGPAMRSINWCCAEPGDSEFLKRVHELFLKNVSQLLHNLISICG